MSIFLLGVSSLLKPYVVIFTAWLTQSIWIWRIIHPSLRRNHVVLGPHPPSLSKSLAPPSHHGWSAHYEWSQVSLPDGEITLRPDITQALLALMPHTPHIIWSLFSLPDRLGNLPTPHTHVLRPQDCFTITIQTRFTDLLISKTLTIHSSIDKIYCVDNF